MNASRFPVENVTAGWGLTAIDIDNDGWLDLVAAVETQHGPELRALRNLGPEGFEDVTATGEAGPGEAG